MNTNITFMSSIFFHLQCVGPLQLQEEMIYSRKLWLENWVYYFSIFDTSLAPRPLLLEETVCETKVPIRKVPMGPNDDMAYDC